MALTAPSGTFSGLLPTPDSFFTFSTTQLDSFVTATPVAVIFGTDGLYVDLQLIGATTTVETTVAIQATSDPSMPSTFPYVETETLAYVIENDFSALCWYPISGNYARLPRVLFYITIAFALLASHNAWLIAGALGAALTYSGAAAVHACALVWVGPGYGELDQYALLSILSVSCIIAVPLLSWSKTLRNLGARVMDSGNEDTSEIKKPAEVDGSSRTIIVCWAFLVTVGFLCMLVNVWDQTLPISPVTFPSNTNITCSPPGGQFDYSSGQNQDWQLFLLTKEFISDNNCIDPCSAVYPGFGAIFRTNDDLKTLAEKDVDKVSNWLLGYSTEKEQSKGTEALKSFAAGYEKFALYLLPYIVVQGILAIIFGPRTPIQVRDTIYLHISEFKYLPIRRLRNCVAKWTAIAFYLSAVVVFVISPFLLIATMVANEFIVNGYPESENHVHVGAWSPYVSTLLVLVAAFIAQYQSWQYKKRKERGFGAKDKKLWARLRRFPELCGETIVNVVKLIFSIAFLIPRQRFIRFCSYVKAEWKNAKSFFKDPKSVARHTNRDGVEITLADHDCALIPKGTADSPGMYSPYFDQSASYSSYSGSWTPESQMQTFSPMDASPLTYPNAPLLVPR